MSIEISTFNVNGIRAASRKGFAELMDVTGPDVVALQEVRASDEIVDKLLGEQWEVVNFPCEVKGRAGVALAVRKEGRVQIDRQSVRFGAQPDGVDAVAVDTGRWLEANVRAGDEVVRVVSAYLHSGQVGTEKMDQKYAHLELVTRRMQELLDANVPTVVCGDLNIVHTERDIKNWKGNHNKSAGVLDEEIAYVDAWLNQGWRDVVRDLVGEEQGPYTWWSYRGKAFDNNAGWRIDYQLASPTLAKRAQAWHVDSADAYDARVSDHAPLRIAYEV
ncbi:exodeoxyribonuclease III [Gleimia hominis]|uniref:exodeoxyribonuclease III n=1 Tax=Gleimia hominis TaxID=595468 RepID=UPI0018EDE236|nr:exodeoxyribonuclease III [Gleimia hominis]WIK63739.1 exodeoxyribonuclease III [Gleimia hominis]